MTTDTIAAVATPPGRGGIGVVRISGPAAAAIAGHLLGALPRPRHARYTTFRDAEGRPVDQGLALYFPAPHSFTGEDVLELHGHGGPVVMDLLLRETLRRGARPARPGEFSERAFLNGKIDLTQAEAVADLIESSSAEAARAAIGSLQGEFSIRIDALQEALTELRLYVEAAIDFPEEEIDFLADERIGARLGALRRDIAALRQQAAQGRLLRDGISVVIAGAPNAGKSSLLNRLAARDSAIVTDIPGTTRDVLREQIAIDGMPLHVIDTAGLRDSGDPIEQEGIRRARAEIESADRVLLVIDASRPDYRAELDALRARLPAQLPVSVAMNKIDLTGRAASRPDEAIATADNGRGRTETDAETDADRNTIWLSAKTGAGIDALREHLKRCSGFRAAGEGRFMARRRHLDALRLTAERLEAATSQFQAGAGELLAEELRLAQRSLGEITGEFTSDDLLGRIFSSFCIGK